MFQLKTKCEECNKFPNHYVPNLKQNVRNVKSYQNIMRIKESNYCSGCFILQLKILLDIF